MNKMGNSPQVLLFVWRIEIIQEPVFRCGPRPRALVAPALGSLAPAPARPRSWDLPGGRRAPVRMSARAFPDPSERDRGGGIPWRQCAGVETPNGPLGEPEPGSGGRLRHSPRCGPRVG